MLFLLKNFYSFDARKFLDKGIVDLLHRFKLWNNLQETINSLINSKKVS